MEKDIYLESSSGVEHEYVEKNCIGAFEKKFWDFKDLLFIKWVILLEQNNMRINIKVNKVFVY